MMKHYQKFLLLPAGQTIKRLLLLLFIVLAFLITYNLLLNKAEAGSATQADIIFLHHSTGGGVYYEGDVPGWIADYNTNNGTSYNITERDYPDSPYPWENYPYDYWNLWVNGECNSSQPGIECLNTLAQNYDVIIWKHCFPGAGVLPNTGSPDITSSRKSLENYKLQYRALRALMDSYPNNIFIVWTLAPLHRLATNADDAARAKQFVDWVNNDWLTEDSQPHNNIYIHDFWGIVAEDDPSPPLGQVNTLRYEYEGGHYDSDSHPNYDANVTAAPIFGQDIVDAIQDFYGGSTNQPPDITITQPDGVGDTADSSYNIQWTDSDPDNDASISLYYDSNNSGQDGSLIVSGLSENDTANSYSWDTTLVANGDYYVYGIINDGVNAQVADYSSGTVTISHTSPTCTDGLCNLSFEDGLNYWVTNGTPNNQVSTDAIDGTYSLRSEHTRTIDVGPSWSGVNQAITSVEPAQTYNIGLWVKSLNAARGHVKIKWYDSVGTISQVNYPIINVNGTISTWTSLNKLVTSPADAVTAELSIWHGINSSSQNVLGSTLWVDDIEFNVATISCGTLCNESFEYGTLYWNVSGEVGSHTIETTAPHEGLKALRSEQQYTSTEPAKWSGITQFAQVSESTTYRLKLWLKTQNASNGHVRIRWRDGSGSLLNTQYPITGITGTNSTWFSRQANVTPPLNAVKAEITLWHGVVGGTTNDTGSTMWIDDMTLICLALCNGGFEDGNVHWEANGINEGEIVITDVYEGNNAMKIAQSLSAADNVQWSGISQRFIIAGGNSYSLSFWIKRENTVQGHVKIKWRDADDQLISTQFPIGGISGTNVIWTQQTAGLTAPGNAETVEVFIWHGVDAANANVQGSTLYIDDISFI